MVVKNEAVSRVTCTTLCSYCMIQIRLTSAGVHGAPFHVSEWPVSGVQFSLSSVLTDGSGVPSTRMGGFVIACFTPMAGLMSVIVIS